MTAREILAYAITHAPPGVKGGPYVADMGYAPVPDLAHAWRSPASDPERARAESKKRRGTRVIRIVRARPSAEPTQQPSEASAVEVLRELVAWSDNEDADTDDVIRIATKARRVLAASGPNPMPVVRAALSWSEATAANGTARTVALQLACVAYRKAGGK